jgi:hypothetical protein
MRGFHIDMNIAQFKRPYLEQWLRKIAELGYDTVIWEVENNVRWRTVPECAAPDAFPPEEFRQIVDLARSLGLESIPILQTLAHCEYVLKHPRYKHLSEHGDEVVQYCPLHPGLRPFLQGWMDEYLDVFGAINVFHVGGDESWWLGSCPRCKEYARQHSLGELYVQHVNAILQYLIDRKIRPALWADMVLSHPHIADLIPRQTIMFDWMYDIYRGSGKVWVWGDLKMCDRHQIPPNRYHFYRRHLFPDGDEPGREPETFYTADFLNDKGFAVVTCPGASHFGDNVFMGRTHLHMVNTYDSWRKGMELDGSVLTSWSVHLHPWELQLPTIELGPWMEHHPDGTLIEYQREFTINHFGLEDNRFWRALGLLSKSILFSTMLTLGHDKTARDVPPAFAIELLHKLQAEGRLTAELENARGRLVEYQAALGLLSQITASATRGGEMLKHCVLAARNLIHRAEVAIHLIARFQGNTEGDAKELLDRLADLRSETESMYEPSQRSARRARIITWLYAPFEHALKDLASSTNPPC